MKSIRIIFRQPVAERDLLTNEDVQRFALDFRSEDLPSLREGRVFIAEDSDGRTWAIPVDNVAYMTIDEIIPAAPQS